MFDGAPSSPLAAAPGETRRRVDSRELPIACALEPSAAAERLREVARLLERALLDRRQIEGGLELRLRASAETEETVRDLVAREKTCCSFLDFSIERVSSGLLLQIRAAAEGQPFIDALFGADRGDESSSDPAPRLTPISAEKASYPLRGRRILVTRPAEQAAELVRALQGLGAEPVVRSAIEVRPVADTTPLDDALRRLATYDWVVFTSRNGVRHVWKRFEAIGGGLEEALEYGESGRSRAGPRVAAIGPGTAAALEARGVRPDFVPAEYVAEALAAGLPDPAGATVLCLRADIARPALRQLLVARGASVDDVAAYRTGTVASTRTDGGEGRLDAVTFTSPSTVRGYLRGVGTVPDGAAVVCIGPITARAAREEGLRVDAVAESYSIPGLVEALVCHFALGNRRR